MSKEQTPLDALNILRALVESNEEHHDYRISTEAVKLCLDEIEEAITKEAQQREELAKVYVIQSKENLIIHGCFSTYERAHKYTNGEDDVAIKELKVE